VARPQKQTVDYFPHDTDAGEKKTLAIIQNKFGNDGYAFWFKLLQLLGKSPGHYYSFRNLIDWEFLLAKTHIPLTETAQEILETLAGLGAIDLELYGHKIIWSQNFVNRLADVYDRRKVSPPPKPDWRVIENNNGVSENNNSIPVSDNPQTKLNKTKLNKTKGEGSKPSTSSSTSHILEIFTQKFPYAFGREPDSREQAMLRDLAQELADTGITDKQIHDAFCEAAELNKRNVPYVRAVLLAWLGIEKKGGWDERD
jgi:hypothetical protein